MTSKRIAAMTLILAVCLLALNSTAQTTFKLKKILETGDDAPVPNRLSFVDQSSLNDQGQVAFIGDGGLFLKSGADLKLVAGFGDSAPGGGTFLQVSTPSMNNAGEIVFVGLVSSPGASGLFLFSQGTITLLIANGAVSTTGDVVFPSEPVINDAGVVAFVNNGFPGFFGQGIFVLTNGIITKVAANGDPASSNGTFTGFNQPAMNASGQIVFQASLQETLANPFVPPDGLFLASGGAITKIIASGDTFPSGSIFFDISGNPSINDGGQVAFAGFVDGSVADEGVYLYSGGILTVTVPAFSPGPNGITFTQPVNAAINNAGQIAFTSQIGNGSGMFLLSNSTISQIMLSGQASPDGDTFAPGTAFDLAINASGEVLFAARLLQHTDALYLSTRSQLARIAGQGDIVNRAPKFEFPFAFGASNQDHALVFDSTFPGGIGFYTADRTPLGKATLDAHVSQPLGADGVIEDFFNSSLMNGEGQVILTADLSSGVSSLLLKSGDALTEVVRASFFANGDPAPGGGTFNFIGQSSINGLGQIVFSGSSSNNSGIYLVSDGRISFAVDSNTLLPDGSGSLGNITFTALNAHGDIAFETEQFGGPGPNGIILFSNGQLTTVALDGNPAPGGGSFSFPLLDPRVGPVISNNGAVAFASGLTTGNRGVFMFF